MLNLIKVVPTLITSAYAADKILFDFTELVGFTRNKGGAVLIKSVTVIDGKDLGVAMDLFVASKGTSLGTVGGDPSISDASDVDNVVQHLCNVATGDYKDLGGLKQATLKNLDLVTKAIGGSNSCYLAGITRGGTPTYDADSLTIFIGVED